MIVKLDDVCTIDSLEMHLSDTMVLIFIQKIFYEEMELQKFPLIKK